MESQNINQTEYIPKTHLSHKAFTLVNNELNQQIRARTLALSEANAALQEQVALRSQAEQSAAKYKNQLEKVYEIIMALAALPTAQEALQTLCEELGQLFNNSQVMAALNQPGNSNCPVIAESSTTLNGSMMGQNLDFENDAVFKQLIVSKRPLLMVDTAKNIHLSQLCKQFSEHNIDSLLVAPIVVEGQVVGGLIIGAKTRHQFSAWEMGYVLTMAMMLGGYISHSNLLQRNGTHNLGMRIK